MMGRKPRISLENRGKVLVLSEEGCSQRTIPARVSCSQKSISEILKKHRITGSVKDRKILGPKRKMTERQGCTKVHKSKMDRSKTAPQIKAEVQLEHGISMSTSTTQRRLREVRLFCCKPRRKPKLVTRHKKACLQYAQAQMG